MFKRFFLALFFFTAVCNCFADSRVFTLVTPHPEEVLESLQKTYGDKIQADLVQGRLLVVGTTKQLDEIAALLVKLDPAPRPIRLTISDRPLIDSDSNAKTYSTNKDAYTIDTVEGAFVTIDYQKIVQQPKSNGWWVTIENEPTQISALLLRVQIEGGRRAIILVNYSKEENQQRRVFGNTVVADLGAWVPLLPNRENPDDGTITSGPKAGDQLYVKVERTPNNPRR
ncbi:MAG: hypothetical protein QM709_10670 [Spongiibacteraceae bacterium]